MDFVLSEFLSGDEFTLENFDEMLKEHYVTEENAAKIKEALTSGKKVYLGYVGFDDAEYSYGDLFETLWNQLAEADPENFTGISTDLSY